MAPPGWSEEQPSGRLLPLQKRLSISPSNPEGGVAEGFKSNYWGGAPAVMRSNNPLAPEKQSGFAVAESNNATARDEEVEGHTSEARRTHPDYFASLPLSPHTAAVADLPTPPLPTSGLLVPELRRLPSLLHAPMHVSNLKFLQGAIFRLVAGMAPSFAPLLVKNTYLREVMAAGSREDLSEAVRQLATRVNQQAVKPAWWASYKEKLQALSSEPHFLTYLHFITSLYRECSNRSMHMQPWFNEVDAWPFEQTLRTVLRDQAVPWADDAEDLTGGVTFEEAERRFEARRSHYKVMAVVDEKVEKKGCEDGGMPYVVYRFDIQRGDGRRLVLFKRYREMFHLMSKLEGPQSWVLPYIKPVFRTTGGRPFPGKNLTPSVNLSKQTRDLRKELFRAYLGMVFKEREVHTSEALCTFLDYTPSRGYPFRVPRPHDWRRTLMRSVYNNNKMAAAPPRPLRLMSSSLLPTEPHETSFSRHSSSTSTSTSSAPSSLLRRSSTSSSSGWSSSSTLSAAAASHSSSSSASIARRTSTAPLPAETDQALQSEQEGHEQQQR